MDKFVNFVKLTILLNFAKCPACTDKENNDKTICLKKKPLREEKKNVRPQIAGFDFIFFDFADDTCRNASSDFRRNHQKGASN